MVSRPHPNAFNRALFMPDGEQARRSRHHKAFLEPDAVAKVLADDARWLRERWAKCGVAGDSGRKSISRCSAMTPAMEAALAWYRARGAIRAPLGVIAVPVLYMWGEADDTVGRVAAEGTRDFVSGPYRFEIAARRRAISPSIKRADRVTELLLAHLAGIRPSPANLIPKGIVYSRRVSSQRLR